MTTSGFSDDGLLDIERAVLHAAECRQLGHLRIFGEIGVIAFRVGLRQVVAPADDALERRIPVQRGDEIDLPAFAENDVLDRDADLDVATGYILDDDLFTGQRRAGKKRAETHGGQGRLAEHTHRFQLHRGTEALRSIS